ncbi:MAG: hypothetical protein IPK60_16260 [Sandaracinaceae bacterium]|nr:hypothetical protein [Sandaracinaceae bacterium]
MMIVRIGVLVLFLGVSVSAKAQSAPFLACGQSDGTAQWGPFSVGMYVKLGVHRAVSGVKNWNESMDTFAGSHTRVTELAGVDDVGCLGVRVSIDGGEYFWRVRDMLMLPSAEVRPPLAATSRELDLCRGTPEYGPVLVGTTVRLKRHRAYGGDDDWTDEMSTFVGHEARVVALVGVDDVGCSGVRVDVDGGEWFWRVRDLNLDAQSTSQNAGP